MDMSRAMAIGDTCTSTGRIIAAYPARACQS